MASAAERAAPEPPVDADDPQAVWARLTAGLGQAGAFAWLDHVRLVAIRGDTAVLAAAPGRREVAGFATEPRLARLAQELSAIVGRRLRARLDPAPAARTGGAEPSGPGTREPGQDADRGDPDPAAGVPGRCEALSMPLVRQVLEAFPDATLIGVRRRDQPPPSAAPPDPELPDPADAVIEDEDMDHD